MSMQYAQHHSPSAASLRRFDRLAHVAAQIISCARCRDEFLVTGVRRAPPLSAMAIHAAYSSRELLARMPERGDPSELLENVAGQLAKVLLELRRSGPRERRRSN